MEYLKDNELEDDINDNCIFLDIKSEIDTNTYELDGDVLDALLPASLKIDGLDSKDGNLASTNRSIFKY